MEKNETGQCENGKMNQTRTNANQNESKKTKNQGGTTKNEMQTETSEKHKERKPRKNERQQNIPKTINTENGKNRKMESTKQYPRRTKKEQKKRT